MGRQIKGEGQLIFTTYPFVPFELFFNYEHTLSNQYNK